MSGARPDTWMPLDIGRYLGDTMHLNSAQHGVYLLLIMAYWRRGGPLPDDDAELSAIGRLTVKDWLKSFRVIMGRFFKIGNGVWWHKRIELELEKAAKNIARATAGGEGKARNKQPASTPQAGDKQDAGTSLEPAKALPQVPIPSPKPEESSPREPPKRGAVDTPEFQSFWGIYPEKVGKGAARRALERALAKAPLENILAGIERYKAAKPADRAWCHPATFLNEERWLDEPAPAANGHDAPAIDESKRWSVRMAHFRRTGDWPEFQGPKPGSVGCQVPRELLTDDERRMGEGSGDELPHVKHPDPLDVPAFLKRERVA